MTTSLLETSLKERDLISISDLSKQEIELVLTTAQKTVSEDLLKGLIVACCFFESSTRTRLSFEAACYRLGCSVIGFADAAITSAKKGESLCDTMKMVENYADLIVIRHPLEGSARLAADVIKKPVINAGDGANQHPTQTLIDLYTIKECQGKIEELHIAMAGDLKYGRTIHSLCLGLAHYPVRLYFVSPETLSLPETISNELKKKGVRFSCHSAIEEILPKVDILYMSRIQKERFTDAGLDFVNPCLLKKWHLEKAKQNLRILHALPRIDEIDSMIDSTPFAYYFQQAANAVSVRMAILALIMGRA